MAINILTIGLHKISKENTERLDVRFVSLVNSQNEPTYSFKDLFDIQITEMPEKRELIESLEDDFLYSEIGDVTKEGDVEPERLNFNQRDELEENFYKKIEKGDVQKPENGNILISKVRPNLKKFVFINDTNKDIFFTTAFINIKPKKFNKIFYYCFRTIFFNDLMAISRQGKGYPTINDDDLQNMRIRREVVSKIESNYEVLNAEIDLIENEIVEIKKQIIPTQEIINNIFAHEFGFNIKGFERIIKNKKYKLPFRKIGLNVDLRSSVNFHKDSAYFVTEELGKITRAKVRNFLATPIILGASISPSDFNESGEYYYVSMDSVKTYSLALDESQLVTDEYVAKNQDKKINQFDIIMTRSGVAIGKFALIENTVKGIFADFTMRIRLSNYNPFFAYYYFRTSYFQHLIHANKKGLQNKNIFPGQVKEFPLIDIPLHEQQRIVDKIKGELDKQEDIKLQISHKRARIEEIINKTLKY